MMHTVRRAASRGLFSTFSGGAVQAVVQFSVLVTLARILTPNDFGLIGAASVVIGFFSVIGHSGIGAALVHVGNLEASLLRVAYTFNLLLALTVYLTLLLATPAIAAFFGMPMLASIVPVLALIIPVTALSQVQEALTQRDLRLGTVAIITLASYSIGYAVFGVALAFLGLSVWSLVAAQVLQAALKSFFFLYFTAHRKAYRPLLRRKELSVLLRYSGWLSFARVANQVGLQADSLIIGRWLGADALGVYNRASQLVAFPAGLVGGTIDKTLFPVLSSLQSEQSRRARGFSLSLYATVASMAPLSAYLITLAPELIALSLGPQWNAAVLPFQVLAGALTFRTAYKVCDSLARATGAMYGQAWRHAMHAGNLFIAAWFGHFWGLSGVAIGVGLAIVLHYLLMLQLSSVLIGAPLCSLLRLHVAPIFIASLLAAILFTLTHYTRHFHLAAISTVMLATALAGALFSVVVAVRPSLLGRDADRIARAIRDLFSSRFGARTHKTSLLP